MSELLLEIFSGEIPARMQEDGIARFEASLLAAIGEVFEGNITATSWVTPRRLGIVIKELSLTFKAASEELRGPRIEAPAQALEGFLKKNNLRHDQLEKRGDYYFAKLESSSNDPINALKDAILTTIKNFVWPKSMIDGDHDLRWVRPVKSILCLLDGKTLEFDYHHIKSGNTTYGHRFMAPASITITSHSDYVEKLTNAHVMLDAEDRKKSILSQAEAALKDMGVRLIADAGLLNEIAGLVEYPKVFVAGIDSEFMALPREVLIITLKAHQRYLMTENSDGTLAPHYLIVANIEPADSGTALIDGNQKVLSARLADAKFFYDLDLKSPLETRIESLKSLTFHADIGSIYTKQQSVATLGDKIAKTLKIDAAKVARAIELAKCDLTTNMVKEFPELQGVMGYHYAIAGGQGIEIATSIRDHYKPQGPNDRLPEGLIASAVALADKLDTLNQMFTIGIKPTSSKDPFALRRAAIGALRIMQHNDFKLDLKALSIRDDVLEFMQERLEVMSKS